MDLLENIIKLNKKYNLIEKNDKIIVGFSGGPDSVFLVEVLKKIREKIDFEIFLVHINHMLRGEKADEDENFSRNYAARNKLSFFSKKIDIKRLALERKKSLEEVGREERYKFFNYILEKVGANKIATAHNKDDQIETFLFRLIRGVSLQGLEGIKIENKNIVRPISETYKKDILNYLNKNEIQYKIDETNFENEFTRNSIRLDLIPFIEERYNSKFKDKLFSLIEEIRENNKENKIFLEDYISKEKIVLEKLHLESSYIQKRIISSYMNRRNIEVSRAKINEIIEILNKTGTKKLDLSKEYKIVKDYDFLYLEERVKEEKNIDERLVEIPSEIQFGNFKISVKEYHEEEFINDKYHYLLDIFPENILKVRTRKAGDKIKLLGKGGTKKVKKIFIDKKIPINKRDRIPILLIDEEIFWLIGIKKGELSLKDKPKGNLQKILFSVEEVKS